MPIPESTQIAVIAMGRLAGEVGGDSGCSVTRFFCLARGWRIAIARLGTTYAKPIGSASPCRGSRITVMELRLVGEQDYRLQDFGDGTAIALFPGRGTPRRIRPYALRDWWLACHRNPSLKVHYHLAHQPEPDSTSGSDTYRSACPARRETYAGQAGDGDAEKPNATGRRIMQSTPDPRRLDRISARRLFRRYSAAIRSLLTPRAMRSPTAWSIFRQYSIARASTGSFTPSFRWPTTLETSRSRAALSMTLRTSAPA